MDDIERIQVPTREAFLRDYVYPQRPVILTNLFEGQQIRSLGTLEDVQRELGEMPVSVRESQEDFCVRLLMGRLMGSGSGGIPDWEDTESTVKEYLELVRREPGTRLQCAEVPSTMISALEARFGVPHICRDEAGQPDDYLSMLWMAGKGNVSHLHYDGDFRNLLQYNICGVKRVLLVPQHAAKRLLPLKNHCAASPAALAADELDRFVRYVDGHHALLHPGEAVFMPAGIWHYFEYLQTSMAITLRFHRNPYLAWIAENLPHDYRTGALAQRFVDDRSLSAQHYQVFDELQITANSPFERPADRVKALAAATMKACSQLGTELQGTYTRAFIGLLGDAAMNARPGG